MRRVLSLLVMMVSLQVFAGTMENQEQDNKTVGIKLEKGKSTDDDKYPRTLLPISCVYVDGTIQLTLLENLGEMELFVTNQTTGEQWKAVNSLVLETSTESGVYWVEIVTENGGTYYGTYTL